MTRAVLFSAAAGRWMIPSDKEENDCVQWSPNLFLFFGDAFFVRQGGADPSAFEWVQLGNNWTHFQGHRGVVYLVEARKQRPEPHFAFEGEISEAAKQLRVLHGSVLCFTFFLRYLQQLWSLSSLGFVLVAMDDKKRSSKKKIIVWWF